MAGSRTGWGRSGASVGHAVPLGYPAYAVVPVPPDDDLQTDGGYLSVFEAVLDVLGPFTGDQPVHCGMWEGWGWWYDTGADPRTAPGMGVVVSWPEGDDRPAREQIDRVLADAREELAAARVERPDVEPLELPIGATTCGLARWGRRRRSATSRMIHRWPRRRRRTAPRRGVGDRLTEHDD